MSRIWVKRIGQDDLGISIDFDSTTLDHQAELKDIPNCFVFPRFGGYIILPK